MNNEKEITIGEQMLNNCASFYDSELIRDRQNNHNRHYHAAELWHEARLAIAHAMVAEAMAAGNVTSPSSNGLVLGLWEAAQMKGAANV